MGEHTLASRSESMPTFETLEEWVRGRIQDLVQGVLDEEVTALLGRTRHARRERVDAAAGYRNGHGKKRRLSLS